ncbi:MAG TPA: hypothetical protein VJ842_16700 [Pyrinomonadaceae bacterium]|nr:hypothetical protein [Pyrinomonadaceae bacterium]
MEETEKLFEPMPVDQDATLATPRFDEVEAQVARPVVPLAGGSHVARRGRRRQWPIALVLISALAGGVVSILAFRMYQQRQQQVVAQSDSETPQADNAAQQASEPTPQAQADNAASATEEQQAQTDAPVVFEEFDPAKEGVATSGDAGRARKSAEADAKPPTAAGNEESRREERKENAKPAPRAAESRPRLVETITASRPVEARGENVSRDERRRDDDFFEERRERRRQRREEWRQGRREERRGPRRNIDRIKDIFEGPPPA